MLTNLTFNDSGGTVNVQAGTLSLAVAGGEFDSGTINTAAGTVLSFDLASSSMSISGALTGTGSGTVHFNTGSFYNEHQSAGDSIPTGTLNFPAGMAQVTGSTFEVYGGDAQLVNAGELDYVGAAAHGDFNIDNKGTIAVIGTGNLGMGNQTGFLNDTTGVIDFRSDAGLVNYDNGHGGSLIVTNKGLIEKTGGTGTSSIGTAATSTSGSVGLGFEDEGGTISAQTGTIDFPTGSAFENTTFNAASGATVSLDDADGTGNGVSYVFSGTLTGAGAGHVVFANNGVRTGGPYDGSFSPTTGAILNFPAGFAQVTGMFFQGGGATQIVNQGFLDYTGSAQHGDMSLDNTGTITVSGSGDLGADNNGGFLNDTTGVLDFKTDAGVVGLGGNTSFTNLGTIEKTAGTGRSVIGSASSGIGFNSSGPIIVDSGALVLQNGGGSSNFTFDGITASAGAEFDVDLGGGDFVTTGTLSVSGGGTFQFDSGYWLNGSSGTTTLNFAPGTFNVGDGAFGNSAGVINTGTINLPGNNSLTAVGNQGTILIPGGAITDLYGFVNDTNGIVNFTGDSTLTDGYHGNIQNNGTIFKSGGSGTLDLSTISFTNSGKIESGSGTIKLPDFGSTLGAGQTLQADAGGTIITPSSQITTNEGSIVLLGAGASIPAAAGLTTNDGTLQVLTGASFTTTGDLNDTGTVIVGGNLTVTGAFNLSQSTTATTPPTLEFAVEAAPGAGAANLTVDGSTALTGDLTAGYAGGFGANAGTAYTVATFASAPTGSFSDTSGVGPAFTSSITGANILLNATGAGGAAPGVATVAGSTTGPTTGAPSDLAVTSVTTPASLTPGQTATISYLVTNNGANPTTGTWTDSVYLSTDTTLDAGDALLGRVTQTGPVAASGGTYTGNFSVSVPAVVPGNYYVIVVTDSTDVTADTSRADNTGFSAVAAITVPSLPLNGSVSGTLAAGQQLIYELNPTGGSDIRVTATLGVPLLSDLLVSRGSLPAEGSAQFSAPLTPGVSTIGTTLPNAAPGAYYIVLTGSSAAGTGQSFTLSDATVANAVYSVSPITVGQGSNVFDITGSGFTSGSSVVLASAGQVVATGTVSDINGSNLSAAFNLTSVQPGTYTLQVTTNGVASTNATPVTITAQAGEQQDVVFNLITPEVVRPNTTNTLYIEYTNPSDVSVPAPLIALTEPGMSFRLVSGNADATIVAGNSFTSHELDLFAIDQEGNAGMLPAGYSGVYAIQFKTLNATTHTTFNPTINLVDDGINLNYSQLSDLGAVVGPTGLGVSEVTAQILQGEMAGISGLTSNILVPTTLTNIYAASPDIVLGSFKVAQDLRTIATTISSAGLFDPSMEDLLQYAIGAADQFGSVTSRQTGGAFGFNTPDSIDFAVVSNGSYTVAQTPAGDFTFLVNADGTFSAISATETATLTLTGGAYTLTQADGEVFQYNPSTTAGGKLATSTDAGGAVTTFSYNAAGELTSIAGPTGSTESFSYNGTGQVISSTSPTGVTTTYGYTVTTGSSTTLSFTHYLLTTITTPAGTTTIDYSPEAGVDTLDVLENVDTGTISTMTVEQYQSLEQYYTNLDEKTHGHFNTGDIVLQQILYYTSSPALADLPTTITLPHGSGEAFSYDGFGRVIKTSFLDGSDPVTLSYDSTGLIVTATAADGSVSSVLRGVNGQLLKETDGDGNTSSIQYNPVGELVAEVIPGGKTETYTYTSTGKIATATDPDGNTDQFTYDAKGNLLGLTDGNGHTITQTYNAADQVTSLGFADGTSIQYAYTSNDLLSQYTDRAGQVTQVTHDAQGRITKLSYADGTSVAYTFDAQGNLVTATGSDGTTTFTYNSANQLTNLAESDGQTISYTYGSNGDVSQESDSFGVVANYSYDSNARLIQVTDGNNAVIVTYGYDDEGRLSTETFGNGTKTIFTYNAIGQTLSITNLSASGTVSTSLTYTYNADDLPVTVTDQSGAVTTYGYDLAGQLTSVALPGGRTLTYAYDAAGNRTSVTDGGVTTAYTSNALDEYTAVGSTTYTYNADGELISSTTSAGTTTYTYNAAGRISGSSGPDGTFTYSYNAMGYLSSFTTNGVVTNLLTDPNGNVIAEFDASGNLIATYRYGLSLLSELTGAGTALYYAFDVAGNTTALTDASGAIVNTYSYLPFGEKLTATGTANNLFTFSGRVGVMDLNDGLYHTLYRAYSPALGRFIQPDPSGLAGGDPNLYRYVANNPILFSDPSGLAFSVGGSSDPGTGGPGGDSWGSNTTAPSAKTGVNKVEPIEPSNTDNGESNNPNPDPETGAEAGGEGAGEGLGTGAAEGTGEAGLEVGGEVAADEFLGTVAAPAVEFVFFNGVRIAVVAASEVAAPVAIPLLVVGLIFWGISQTPAEAQTLDQPPAPDDPGVVGPLPPGTLHPVKTVPVQQLNAQDPNSIYGPIGSGTAQYVGDSGTLSYTITFQNDPTASLPAAAVTVTTTLDPNVDLSRFQLTDIGFGSEVIAVPAGLQSYSTTVAYTEPDNGKAIDVKVTASLDLSTRVLTWTLQTLDPTTLDAPSDATIGFLPPDDSTGRGEGFVGYTVAPLAGVASGTAITAQGRIVFDTNAAIATPVWSNTIDDVAPTSTLTAIAATTLGTAIPLTWTGSDDASGIASYTIYVSEDGAAFTPWLSNTTATSGVYFPAFGHTYAFDSVATDLAGNVQTFPATAQAATTVPAIAKTLTFSKGKPARFVDAAGVPVTVTLTGVGTGTLSFLSTGNADPVELELDSTTLKSSVTVSVPRGSMQLGTVQVNGALASFTASRASFVDTFTVTGALQSLTLGDETIAPGTISIAGTSAATTFRFGTVHDLTLTDAATIKSLTVTSWTDGAAATDAITAPSIGTITAAGNFDPTLKLSGTALDLKSISVRGTLGGAWTVAGNVGPITAGATASTWNPTVTGSIGGLTVRGGLSGTISARSLGNSRAGSISAATITLSGTIAQLGKVFTLSSLTVTGTVANSDILAQGNIGAVTAAGFSASELFAGIVTGTTTLPTATTAFAAAASIKSVRTTGRSAFADTLIAASAIGSASLSDVTTSNGGTIFGIATESLKTFTLTQPKQKPFSWNSKKAVSLLAALPGDLRVSVL